MASFVPFEEDDVPIETRFRQMNTEELLSFWEHTQKLFFVFLQQHGVAIPPRNFPTEDIIIAELMRREVQGLAGGSAGAALRLPSSQTKPPKHSNKLS